MYTEELDRLPENTLVSHNFDYWKQFPIDKYKFTENGKLCAFLCGDETLNYQQYFHIFGEEEIVFENDHIIKKRQIICNTFEKICGYLNNNFLGFDDISYMISLGYIDLLYKVHEYQYNDNFMDYLEKENLMNDPRTINMFRNYKGSMIPCNKVAIKYLEKYHHSFFVIPHFDITIAVDFRIFYNS